METRTTYVTKTRTLADGTVKQYRSKMTYQVKNGVNDGRASNNGRKKIELTPEQAAEVWAKHCADVKIKRICQDTGLSRIIIKRFIDEKTAELAGAGDNNIQAANVQPPN